MKKRRLPHAINTTDPAVFHKPPQGRSNVVILHAALHGEPGDRRERLVVLAGVMPQPGVNEEGALAICAGFEQRDRHLGKARTRYPRCRLNSA
jgi:hypothetical protein